MKKIGVTYDRVGAFHYKPHKISLNRGGSYINSSKWLKNKKAAISPKYKKRL